MSGGQQGGNHGQLWGMSEACPRNAPKQSHKKLDQTSQAHGESMQAWPKTFQRQSGKMKYRSYPELRRRS